MNTPSGWENFSVEELSCKCGCGKMFMNADFMEKVVEFRKFFGPLIVNSAYRCEAHDKDVGTSATPGSGPHTMGRAIDFKMPAAEIKPFLELALKLKTFTGYGLDERQSIPDDSRFCHVDDLKPNEYPSHVRPALWTYP
jgi:zinc D-Ala-D-Ala carboxypeptidase